MLENLFVHDIKQSDGFKVVLIKSKSGFCNGAVISESSVQLPNPGDLY